MAICVESRLGLLGVVVVSRIVARVIAGAIVGTSTRALGLRASAASTGWRTDRSALLLGQTRVLLVHGLVFDILWLRGRISTVLTVVG